MSLVTRHLYRSANGDRWSLMTDTSSGREFVRHEANQPSGGHLTDTDVDDFLDIRGSGPEFVALREILAAASESGVSLPKSKQDEDQARPPDATLRQETSAARQPMNDEEKVLAGHVDVNMPALLTKDVPGG